MLAAASIVGLKGKPVSVRNHIVPVVDQLLTLRAAHQSASDSMRSCHWPTD